MDYGVHLCDTLDIEVKSKSIANLVSDLPQRFQHGKLSLKFLWPVSKCFDNLVDFSQTCRELVQACPGLCLESLTVHYRALRTNFIDQDSCDFVFNKVEKVSLSSMEIPATFFSNTDASPKSDCFLKELTLSDSCRFIPTDDVNLDQKFSMPKCLKIQSGNCYMLLCSQVDFSRVVRLELSDFSKSVPLLFTQQFLSSVT